MRQGNTLAIASLNCTGSSPFAYAWTSAGAGADPITQGSVSFSSTTSATPIVTVSSPVFGSLNLQVVVTDSLLASTTYVIHDGIAPFDPLTGVINYTAEGLTYAQQTILARMVAYGGNVYTDVDQFTLTELRYQSCLLGISAFSAYCPGGSFGAYGPFWRTFETGTLTFTSGSAIVTGSGTHFLSTICNGGGAVVSGEQFFWNYTGTDGKTDHNGFMQPLSCADDTHLTLAAAYPASPSPLVWPVCSSTPAACTGLSWGHYNVSTGVGGNWTFNSAPGNYYDVLEMFWRTYWGTGWDVAYSSAQTMLTYWLEIPFNDYFYNCGNNSLTQNGKLQCGNGADPGRAWSITGVVLAEQSGRSDLLPGLEQMWFRAQQGIAAMQTGGANNPQGPSDLRDDGYRQDAMSDCMLIETGSQQSTCAAASVAALTNGWTPFRKSQTYLGNTYHLWNNFYWGASSITALGGGGSVCVTNGSGTVTGSGTTWPSSIAPSGGGSTQVWFFSTPATLPADNSTGDSQTYIVSGWSSGTSITITPVYAGATLCTVGFAMTAANSGSGLVGWGWQAYMEMILSQSFSHNATALTFFGDPTNAAIYAGYAHDAALAVAGLGITPDQGGFYNAAGFPGCTPALTAFAPQWAIASCYGWNGYITPAVTAPTSRILALDAMEGFALDYAATPSAAIFAAGEALMSQMFCGTGTCGTVAADGNDLSPFFSYPSGIYVSGAFAPALTGSKYGGQGGGFAGAGFVWPGIRNKGLIGPVTNSQGVSGAGAVGEELQASLQRFLHHAFTFHF
jgi:hypothetical protein